MTYAIETVDLRKVYPVGRGFRSVLHPFSGVRSIEALRGVDLRVEAGEVYGILGPNGAGKTTLIKILATLLHPDSGSARVFGLDVVRQESAVKRRIGYVMGEERSFYWRLSGLDNLRFFAALDDLTGSRANRRISDVLRLVGLEVEARRPFRQYSSGMRQKLAIARALLSDPEVLLMDEPTRSLDPESAATVRDLMSRWARERGRAVLFATHNLEEAGSLCSRIGMMFYGHIRAEGSPEEIRAMSDRTASYEIVFKRPCSGVERELRGFPGVRRVSSAGESVYHVDADVESFEVSDLLKRVLESGFRIESSRRRTRDLGSVFADLARGEG